MKKILAALMFLSLFGSILYFGLSNLETKMVAQAPPPQKIEAVKDEEETIQLDIPAINCKDIGGTANCTAFYMLDTEIDARSAMNFLVWLETAKSKGVKNVVIQLSTSGGDLIWGYRIIRNLENSGMTSYCISDFQTISMGYAILQSCTHRLMTPRSFLLTHKPYLAGVSKNTVITEEGKKLTDYVIKAYNAHCVHRMKITLNEYNIHVNAGNWFMGPEEAIKVGAVDRIVPGVWEVVNALRAGKGVN